MTALHGEIDGSPFLFENRKKVCHISTGRVGLTDVNQGHVGGEPLGMGRAFEVVYEVTFESGQSILIDQGELGECFVKIPVQTRN